MGDDDKPLRFTIEIFNAQFVTSGRYFLILRIVGSKVKQSKLKLYVGSSDVALEDYQFTTDACLEDGDPETLVTFTDSVITFWMPPGMFIALYLYLSSRFVVRSQQMRDETYQLSKHFILS